MQQLNPRLGEGFNGARVFDSRPSAFAPLVSLIFGTLIGFLSVRSRRVELASARHCGVSVPDQLAHLLIETIVWCLLALSLTVSALWIASSIVVPNYQGFVLAELLRIPLLAAAGGVAGCVASVLTTREHHLFRYFKQRT
ncbi:hypothetical protein A6A27_40160 [Micromonospora sp. CB01531]|nr:hypothetical protein A6A27_40160 [Micromonospora sp. CB01531]